MDAHLMILLCFTCGLLTTGAVSAVENGQAKDVFCPKGWVRFASRCFMFFNSQKTWMDAEKVCIAVGGNLASVHNNEENTFIVNLIKRVTGAAPHTWLGGHDAVEEGTWIWSDGSKFNYQYWATGEPNNAGGSENCLLVNWSGDHWNDFPCRWTLPFVCSRDLAKTHKRQGFL